MANYAGTIGLNSRYSDIREVAGNALLVAGLAESGYATAYILRGGYDFTNENAPVAHAYTAHVYEGTGLTISKSPVVLPLGKGSEAIRVVRTRVQAPKELDAIIPVVNSNKLRTFGGDKWKQYTLLKDHMPVTVFASNDSKTNSELASRISDTRVVIKSTMGRDAKWLKIVEPRQAAESISLMRVALKERGHPRADIIVQAYQPGVAFGMLRGLSATEATLLHHVPPDTPTELRIYCFVVQGISGMELEMYGVYRLHPGAHGEQFMPIDQESIPEAARQLALWAAERVVRACSAPGGLIAVDLIRQPDGALSIREVNTHDPALAGIISSSRELQRQQMDRLCWLLARLAAMKRS